MVDILIRLNSPIKHPQDSVNQRQEASFEIKKLRVENAKLVQELDGVIDSIGRLQVEGER